MKLAVVDFDENVEDLVMTMMVYLRVAFGTMNE
jgi:hypothetical protein